MTRGIRRFGVLQLIIITLLSIAVAFGVYWLLKPPPKINDQKINPLTQATSQSTAAAGFIKQADYQGAVNAYLLSADGSAAAGNYKAAIATLQTCIKNVPDAQVPYYIYDALAAAAQKAGDKTLQKASLSRALTKAQLPGSGAGSETVNLYQQKLSQLEKP